MVTLSAMADFREVSGVSTLRAALTVCMLGILLAAYGLEFLWSDRGYPNEVTATATVTGTSPTSPRQRRQGTIYRFQFTTPDGRQITGSSMVTPSGSLDRDGDTVTILYPPDAPQQARLWVTRSGLEFLPLAFGAAFTLGGLRTAVIQLRKRRRLRSTVVS